MALSRVKTWAALEVLTASDLNAEFNNILNNALSLISPLTGTLDLDGQSLLMDAAGSTTLASPTTRALTITPGAKSGTPGTTGSVIDLVANTFTDSNTAVSGTATNWVGTAIQRPTVGASNSGVTISHAASLYVANGPAAGSNVTIGKSYALWTDDGINRFDGMTLIGAPATTTDAAAGDLVLAAGNKLRIAYADGTHTADVLSYSSGNRIQLGGGYNGTEWIQIFASTNAGLPSAGASQNGLITLDKDNNRFIFYVGGSRFYVTGTSF